MIDEVELGKFINKLRIEAGLTQDELAKKVGVSSGKIVSKWENGNNIPDFITLKKISIVLNVTLYELSECKRLPKKRLIDATKDFIKSSIDIFKLNIIGKVTIVATILLGIFFGLCTIFTIDTYNTVEIYKLSSLNEDFKINGNIILTKDYSLFNLINIDYIGKDIDLNINVDNLTYHVINNRNNKLLTHLNNNIRNSKKEYINVLDNIRLTRFSILMDITPDKKIKLSDNEVLRLQIIYEDNEKNVEDVEFPFKIIKKYQNIL